jgi:PTS system mannose-specific IIA component
MIGVLIVTHGHFGEACEEVTRHFFGEKPLHIRCLCVHTHDDIEVLKRQAKQLRDEIDFGYGVLILNDIFGATPFNISKALIDEQTVLLTGANVPMVVKAASYGMSGEDIQTLLKETKEAAFEGIIDITVNNLEQYD